MSPIDIQDILERAKNSARGGDHEEAERLLKSYIPKVPDSREARLLLGTTFAKEGKLSEAADEFVALLARDPEDIEALNNVAVIYRRQGKFQEALDYLQKAIDIDPTRAEFFYNIGNIHKQLNNSKAASMAYARVIELDSGYVPAYNNLGTIYQEFQEYDKAFGMFHKGLTLDPNNPTLHFNYGVALEANNRLEDAAVEYRAAMRSKPGWPAPMNNLGIVLFKQGHHDKAIATFNHILNTDPFNAEAHNNMGVVLADQGRTSEAVKNYRQAMESDPRYTKAVVNLERALEVSGDFSDALIELEKLVKLSPDNAEIRSRLAGLYLKMERYPEALEQAEHALEWEPESVPALRIQGAAQRVMGNDSAAQASFEKILSLDPGNYSFLLDLADIHFHRKEYKEAEERIQSYLIRRPNDRNAKLLLGKLYTEMGNRTHAIQVFEELSRADPNDTEALAAAAELLKDAGSLEKALRTADTLVNLQGKRATATDLTELNKSLEFYENAVNAYSSSVKEMWDRNIKLMSGEEEESPGEDDVSVLMGAAELANDIDEETETLFTEGTEPFDSGEIFPDEDEEDLVLNEIPEETEQPLYQEPLDALIDEPLGRDRSPDSSPARPMEAPVPEPAPEKPAGKAKENTAPPAWLSSGAEESEAEAPVSQMSELPAFPEYPEYPAFSPAEDKPEPETAEVPEKEPLPEPAAVDEVEDEPLPEPAAVDEIEEEPLFEEPSIMSDEYPESLDTGELEDYEEFEVYEEPLDVQKPLEAEEPVGAEPLLLEELPFSPEPSGLQTPDDEGSEISEVIDLLKYLKHLTEDLPEIKRDSFLEGRYPVVLESVIDSLKNLTIIKEKPENVPVMAALGSESQDAGGDFDGN